MTLSWNDAIGFLRVGDFQQAAASLEHARQECERQGETVLAAAINATQKLCMLCLECSTATFYHQQALAAMSNQLDKLSAELFDLVGALQQMELHPAVEVYSAPTLAQEPRAMQQQSLWQRLSNIMARERIVAHPFMVPPLKTSPLVINSDDGQASAALGVCCFGPFRVYQHDQPVKEWISRKGKSIFKYLIAHRDRPISKEVLMDLIWPDTPPEAARNNLNVAIYGLRQSLRQAGLAESTILYQDDCYLINPELTIWVDVEAFSAHVAQAQELEESGQPIAAMQEYRLAEALYTGDYLEEDRYEDWPRARRQSLKETYMTVLERLCQSYYVQGDFTACVAEAHKILAADSCRESAHRWIMQCYAQQGQRYLAIRQYQDCIDALEDELGVEPSPETTQLYRQILTGDYMRSGAPFPAAMPV
jgi:DNA-binding SARP family transcriptional activator